MRSELNSYLVRVNVILVLNLFARTDEDLGNEKLHIQYIEKLEMYVLLQQSEINVCRSTVRKGYYYNNHSQEHLI